LVELWVPAADVPRRLAEVAKGAQRAGRDPAELDATALVQVHASPDGAIDDRLRNGIAGRIASRPELDSALRGSGVDPDAVVAVRDAVREHGREQASALVSREMIQAFCAAGNPDECVRTLRAYDRVGIKRAIIFPLGGDADLALQVGARYLQESR
jgi:alkanesulfonate monooxygenase SsuD/methylene tetrahydromethanopterin reductase-like flavin-dependent oxidoreductase (luciferase family)